MEKLNANRKCASLAKRMRKKKLLMVNAVHDVILKKKLVRWTWK